MGLRLRDVGSTFTWHDLWVIARNLPRESALVREVEGEDHPWGYLEQLSAAAVDALNILIWQQTKDGAKGKNQPKPIPRPGIEQPKQYGKEAISMDEMADWLGWERQLAQPTED